MASKKWTEEEKEFVKENYLTMTHKEMGKQINRSKCSVGQLCFRCGYKKQMLYIVFSDYFKDENALNVGIRLFVTADGSVECISKNSYKLDISLKLEDESYLIRIRDELAPDRPLTYGMAKCKGKEYPCVRFTIYDKVLVKNLIEEWGVEPAKSKNYKFRYTACADEFKPDALRCLFDGDGCINVGINKDHGGLTHRFKITSSSKLFLEDIQRELGFGYGYVRKEEAKKHCWNWEVRKRQHIQHLYRFMYYNDDVFCLQRKKDIFKPIMEAGVHCSDWSDKEIKFLQENWEKMTNKELAEKLNRTVGSVKRKYLSLLKGTIK